jgi:hypothetical protein
MTQQEYTARSGGHKVLSIGSVPRAASANFFQVFNASLVKAQQRKGDKRSAANHKQGHQKTPAFIVALLTQTQQIDWMKMADSLESGQPQGNEELLLIPQTPEVAPRGGFTDVGLHTGGKARNTPWPLVQAVIQVSLSRHLR